MKKVISACGLLFCILHTFDNAKGLAKERSPGNPCPNFLVADGSDPNTELDVVSTSPQGSKCLLHQDVIGLAKTFQLPSGVKLDCQGHKIAPTSSGVLGDKNSRSVPELAIFMNHGRIKDCVIDGFDHGILATHSGTTKSVPDYLNRIEGNVIRARFVGVHLVEADRFDIEGNKILWLTRGGAGVLIHHNSDEVEIKDNEITGDFPTSPTPIQGAVLMPGPALSSNPVFNSGHAAILALESLGAHPQLFTAIINGEVQQFKASESASVNESFTEDTLIENNAIDFRADNTTEDGIVASATIGSVIRGNTIGKEDGGARMRQAIRAGGSSGFPRDLPGQCRGKDRLCLSNLDCNIPGIDGSGPDICEGLGATTFAIWVPENLSYQDNTIYGPFGTAMATTGDTIIEGNQVYGRRPIGATANFGVAITLAGKFAIEQAVVKRNRVSDVDTAFRFMNVFSEAPTQFGVKVSLNDITGATKAVVTSNDYTLPSELSVDANGNICGPDSSDCRGNFWGLTCPLAFDPTKAKMDNGSQAPVTDSHPYQEEVAELPDELLPATCE